MLKGKKAILDEIGPYTYREVVNKTEVKFLPENKISYKPLSTLYYEPSLSNGDDTDMIYFLNIPIMVNYF